MINNTHFSQFIPPTMFHCVTGTYTHLAGAVLSTIAIHRAAAASTGVVTVPLAIPSNSVALQGALLKSIEVDYELLLAGATSVTAVLNKVVRGADTAVAVVTQPVITQDLAAGVAAATQDQHKLTVTLTTPEWIDNDAEYLLQLSFICGGVVTVELYGAVVNYTFRS